MNIIRINDHRQNVLIAAEMLLSIIFCACSSDIAEDTPEDEAPMVFGANVPEETQTRAIIDETTLQSQGFSVYGYKQKSSGTYTQIFSNQSVTWDTSVTPNKWTYTPLKYWDKSQGMKYYFTAYAPTTSSIGVDFSSSEEDHSISVSNIPQWQPATASGNTAYDLIVADKSGSSSSATDFPNGVVNLDFHHKLALLELQTTTASTSTDYSFEITSVSIDKDDVPHNVYKYTHTYAEKPTDAFSILTTESTPDDVSLYSGSFTVPTSATAFSQTLVVPFFADDQISIKISYKLKDSSNNETSKEVTVSTGLQEFKSDSKYIINIIFNSPDNIIIEVYQRWQKGYTDETTW